MTAALVLLAGCGGGSSSAAKGGTTTSSSTTSSSTTSSSPPAPSPSPTVTPATKAQLKEIVLRATDLPRGWKASPPEPDGSNSSDQAELAKCAGAKNTEDDEAATVDSDDFTLGNATISALASSYKSQSSLDSDLALLKSPKLIPCYKEVFKKEAASALSKDATLGAVSVKFTPGPGAGPANVAGSGSATTSVNVGDTHLKVYISFVYVTGPLMEVEVDAFNVGSPVPAAVLQAAVKAVADRAAASGG